MNMPVLPVTSPSPPPADAPVRGADAAETKDTPAFSNVLSQQRDGASRPHEPRRAKDDGHANPDPSQRHDPLGPDETLSLILDSAALPLMQAAAVPVETRPIHAGTTSGQADHADPRAARLPIEIAACTPSDTLADAPDALPADTDAPDRAPAWRTDRAAAATPAARILSPADPASVPDTREPSRIRTGTAQPQTGGQPLVSLAASDPVAPALSAARLDTRLAATPDAVQLTPSTMAPAGAAIPPSTATLPAPAAAAVTLPTPLANPQWPQDFSRQILHLTQNLTGAGSTVQMHVSPPELGPIHITLHVSDSIAQASFVSPHASVRQALENALPHLEQQLAQAGLSLGQADVGDQQPGQQAQGQTTPARHGESSFSLDGQVADSTALPVASAPPRTLSRPDALVDTFA